MKGKMLELKNYLKEKAQEIREERKENGYSYKKENMSYDYRHHHIAYSEMRGKTREQIECPREGNEPDEYKIEKIKTQYTEVEENEETLRASA